MTRRLRNVVIFVASVLGAVLFVIGAIALSTDDSSGWRAIIGASFAFVLAFLLGKRQAARRAPEP